MSWYRLLRDGGIAVESRDGDGRVAMTSISLGGDVSTWVRVGASVEATKAHYGRVTERLEALRPASPSWWVLTAMGGLGSAIWALVRWPESPWEWVGVGAVLVGPVLYRAVRRYLVRAVARALLRLALRRLPRLLQAPRPALTGPAEVP